MDDGWNSPIRLIFMFYTWGTARLPRGRELLHVGTSISKGLTSVWMKTGSCVVTPAAPSALPVVASGCLRKL